MGTWVKENGDMVNLSKPYNDAIIAPAENNATSQHAYSVNAFARVRGALKRIIAPIASGDPFSSGNSVSTTVGDELKYLRDSLSDNGEQFRFGYDTTNDQFGYYREVGGADTFFPFRSILKDTIVTSISTPSINTEYTYALPSTASLIIIATNLRDATYSSNYATCMSYVCDIYKDEAWKVEAANLSTNYVAMTKSGDWFAGAKFSFYVDENNILHYKTPAGGMSHGHAMLVM